MNKSHIALLTVLALGVATPLVLQHRQVNRLRAANQELRTELERVRGERDEFSAANERLRSTAAKAQADQNELARLRGDVSRLRRDLASAMNQPTNGATSRAHSSSPPDSAQTRLTPFTGTARVSLEPGQTLVMGGWPTVSGKRTLALMTPEASAGGQQGTVVINSVYIQVPEALLSGPGWEQFQAVTKDTISPSGVFAPGQAKQFLEALQKLEGVDILSSPRVATTSGQRASISIGGSQEAGLQLDLLPVVAADGRTVDLSVTNSIGLLPGR
jgi:hypothetical protein